MFNRMELVDEGYVVVPQCVPPQLCKAVIQDIEEHTKEGMECVDLQGMVEMYHYQSMWEIRQHPALHEAFAILFDTNKLWVSIDRCNRKVPEPDFIEERTYIHWDINVNARPRPMAVQGLVALADTDADMGGFCCVPQIYHELDSLRRAQPTGKFKYNCFKRSGDRAYRLDDSYPLDAVQSWPIKQVPMLQGDLLIWNSFLPHGNSVNRGKRIRYAQYVTMRRPGDLRESIERTECWLNNLPPSDWPFPGDPRKIEQGFGKALLTPLGQSLLNGAK